MVTSTVWARILFFSMEPASFKSLFVILPVELVKETKQFWIHIRNCWRHKNRTIELSSVETKWTPSILTPAVSQAPSVCQIGSGINSAIQVGLEARSRANQRKLLRKPCSVFVRQSQGQGDSSWQKASCLLKNKKKAGWTRNCNGHRTKFL